MQIRQMTPLDLPFLVDIDATIELSEYLHIEHHQDGLGARWVVEPRPMREKKCSTNSLGDDELFDIRQVVGGVEDGLAVVAEHDGHLVGLLVARDVPTEKLLDLLEIRVDFDMRRQGIATAAMFQLINFARQRQARAVRACVSADNVPACQLLAKLGFVLSGLDTRRRTNHDLVKEQATLIWHYVMND